MTVTGAQCLAARELLGWSRARLARAAKLSRHTIYNIEHDDPRLSEPSLSAVRQAFERARVVFEEDGQVRRRVTP
jgi:DNA-binding XRE family transcriptional regulator